MIVETEYRLEKSLSATFDSAGRAVVTFQNSGLSRWKVKLLSTSTTSTAQTVCTVFRGDAGARQVDFTRTGNKDVSPVDLDIQTGDRITVVWTGGTVGSIATFYLEGSEFVRGRRAY